jgi:hypothetical protein
MNSLHDDKEITFENICDKYKIIYSVKPYAFDKKRNVIEIPQRIIHSNCIINIGTLSEKECMHEPLYDSLINCLTIFSGHNTQINNLIEKIYNYINQILPDAYLIVFVRHYQIYFQIIDKLFEKYTLLQNKAYTTYILFCFHYNKLNNDKLMFYYNFKD